MAPPGFLLTTEEREKILEETIKRKAPITEELINQLLCGRKDCPAAKKFKEYGLGPLAQPGSGRGLASGETKQVCPYGMSQTYGTFDLYGPYGAYLEPQDPSQPYIGKNVMDELWSPPKPNIVKNCCPPSNSKKSINQSRGGCCSDNGPTRLRGGGSITNYVAHSERSVCIKGSCYKI